MLWFRSSRRNFLAYAYAGGYFIGIISNYIGIQVDPVVIGLVGMGAFLAAVARTPITI